MSQTVAEGGTATWSISVTNTGGAYLYAVNTSDALAPGCGMPGGADGTTLYFMAPNVTVTYPCTLSAVTGSFTNTIDATATTQAGPKITTHCDRRRHRRRRHATPSTTSPHRKPKTRKRRDTHPHRSQTNPPSTHPNQN